MNREKKTESRTCHDKKKQNKTMNFHVKLLLVVKGKEKRTTRKRLKRKKSVVVITVGRPFVSSGERGTCFMWY